MIASVLARALQNKHTSGAAVALVAVEIAGGVFKIWAPHYQPQIDETVRYVEKMAIGYGLIMAGDAKPPGGDGQKPPV